MTLKEWRNQKGWTQNHLANALTKKLGRPITRDHISAWEDRGVMPGADVGEAVRKITKGAVTWGAQLGGQ